MSDPRALKPYAAHGWVVMRTIYTRGGAFTYVINSPSTFPVHLYTKGKINVFDIDTNTLESERGPGFWGKGKENFSKSSWKIVVEEGSEVWCFDPVVNKNIAPPVTLFSLSAGETKKMTPEDKLFLCAGVFIAQDAEVTGPKQVSFSSACEIQAKSDCYGVLVG